ncbi:glycosyltransferase family 2 protein [Halobellus rubicundus]|uniref:Glycosyltransferase family 2 protein n=1 Tax=Halobellus rubicundus TaxID=2996466 RepID=A0ABD5MFJ1_9EURY
MKILITMAGRGSRFREVGVSRPKHEIEVRGEPMFDWAMRSLEAFFDEEFVFVAQAEHSPTAFIDAATTRLGIGSYNVVILDEYTAGQASTAMAAADSIGSDSAVAIYNIDTYIEEGALTPDVIEGDGFIPTFSASGTRWSFVETTSSGEATAVSEKEKISNEATVGFYYFDRWAHFVDAYRERADSVEGEYGETYVAPLYNHLIERGGRVTTYELDPEDVHVLGTPTDLERFDGTFDPMDQT